MRKQQKHMSYQAQEQLAPRPSSVFTSLHPLSLCLAAYNSRLHVVIFNHAQLLERLDGHHLAVRLALSQKHLAERPSASKQHGRA